MMYKSFIKLLLFAVTLPATAQQTRFDELAVRLETFAMEYPKMDKEIDISFTGTVQEFVLAFSRETHLNLTIDPSLKQPVATHFSETRPRDILLHLCRMHDLDITFSGSILSLTPFQRPPEPVRKKPLDIRYNAYNQKLEMNLRKDTLDQVLKTISQLTGQNIIAARRASQEPVGGYIGATALPEALDQMAKRNDLIVIREESGYYLVDKTEPEKGLANNPQNSSRNTLHDRRTSSRTPKNRSYTHKNLQIEVREDSLGENLFRVQADDVPIHEVIRRASEAGEHSFFMFTEPEGKITLDLEAVTYNQLVKHVLQGSAFTCKQQDGVYLFGARTLEGLREAKVWQLQHRSVQDVIPLIPEAIAGLLQITEFTELNALVLSGPAENVAEVLAFVAAIDQPVPVVTIELLIVDFQDNKEVRIGLEAGITDQGVVEGGSLYPGLDFTFGAQSVNRLLRLLEGNGIVNLGRVSSGFYATLQAIENNGFAKVISRPRLSTLNGREANLSIGETRYYVNERTTLQGNQSPISLQDRRFEAVNADFSVRILPVISGDEYITLEIEVSQSDFIGQIQTDAPPAQVNRSFTSNIRILDREMVVLGGLESTSMENSGTGVPWLSRIPVLKWFFSKRRKAKGKTQLLIFVRPRVMY